MPYTTDKPPDQIKGLPKGGKAIWIAAFNAAIVEYKDDETKASATAWAAVKTKYEQDKEGNWRILEVNRACQFEGFEKATGINVPKAVIEYLLKKKTG